MTEVSPVQLPPNECYRTLLMTSQHSFKKWLGSIFLVTIGIIFYYIISFCKDKSPRKQYTPGMINSLGPSDVIWRHRSGSRLVRVTARCDAIVILWPSPEGDFTRSAQDIYPWYKFKNYWFKTQATSPRSQWVNVVRALSYFVAVWQWPPLTVHFNITQLSQGYAHYDVIMGAMASEITSHTIVYSTDYSDADQREHQSSASLAFVWGLHRSPVNSPQKWPVTRKMHPFDDVIMDCPSANEATLASMDKWITWIDCALVIYPKQKGLNISWDTLYFE